MSGVRWLLSLLLLYHLVAVAADAIPSPDELTGVAEVRHPHDDGIAALVTPMLDRAALSLARFEPTLFAWSQPLRQITQPYISAGLRQHWVMFAGTITGARYVRLDYYVATDGSLGNPQVFRELVLPSAREDRVRWLRQYLDKAVVNTLDTYFTNLAKYHGAFDGIEPPGRPSALESSESLPRDFVPLLRYFRTRFQRTHLPANARIVRTDLWYGVAEIPPPVQPVNDRVSKGRRKLLNEYQEGPTRIVGTASTNPQRGAVEQEADILWKLEYVEKP
jgi:hypothetical protein